MGYAGQPPCGVVAIQRLERQAKLKVRSVDDIFSTGKVTDPAGGMTPVQVRRVLKQDGFKMITRDVESAADLYTLAKTGDSFLFFRYMFDVNAGRDFGHWEEADPKQPAWYNKNVRYEIHNFDGQGNDVTQTPAEMMSLGGAGPYIGNNTYEISR